MEEKILIKSERINLKKLVSKLLIIGVALSAIAIFGYCASLGNEYEKIEATYQFHNTPDRIYDCNSKWQDYERCYKCRRFERIENKSNYISSYLLSDDVVALLMPFIICALVGDIAYLWLRSYELTVTDKRIYGKIAFDKRVDLPVDSVSATAITRPLKGVCVSTASGKISFLVMKNYDEIYSVINKLLIERQDNKKIEIKPDANEPQVDETDLLMKYKNLLDQGVITQEEFDAKKKQILGL